VTTDGYVVVGCGGTNVEVPSVVWWRWAIACTGQLYTSMCGMQRGHLTRLNNATFARCVCYVWQGKWVHEAECYQLVVDRIVNVVCMCILCSR